MPLYHLCKVTHSPDKCFIILTALVLFCLHLDELHFSRENKCREIHEILRFILFLLLIKYVTDNGTAVTSFIWPHWKEILIYGCSQQHRCVHLHLRVCLMQLTSIVLGRLVHVFILCLQCQRAPLWKSGTIKKNQLEIKQLPDCGKTHYQCLTICQQRKSSGNPLD